MVNIEQEAKIACSGKTEEGAINAGRKLVIIGDGVATRKHLMM